MNKSESKCPTCEGSGYLDEEVGSDHEGVRMICDYCNGTGLQPQGETTGEQIPSYVHKKSACEGSFCPYHNPSNHPLKGARKQIRLDKHGLVERVCEHGIGHSDPDSVAYFESIGIKSLGVHGCDGCCTGNFGNLTRPTTPEGETTGECICINAPGANSNCPFHYPAQPTTPESVKAECWCICHKIDVTLDGVIDHMEANQTTCEHCPQPNTESQELDGAIEHILWQNWYYPLSNEQEDAEMAKSVASIRAIFEAYTQKLVTEALIVELGKATPYNLAQYFAISVNDIDNTWLQSYINDRINQLKGGA